jgi:hypothetical protein
MYEHTTCWHEQNFSPEFSSDGHYGSRGSKTHLVSTKSVYTDALAYLKRNIPCFPCWFAVYYQAWSFYSVKCANIPRSLGFCLHDGDVINVGIGICEGLEQRMENTIV